MSLKVTMLEISGFRGISGSARISLSDADGRPCSLLLCGDNGTGKSSFVDALEFGLQARISKSSSLTNPQNPAALSLASGGNARVKIGLSDGSTVQRLIKRTGQKPYAHPKRPHPGFSCAPIVLRRSDITRFWDTPELERQVFFFDYFLPPVKSKTEPTLADLEARIDSLTRERLALKEARRKVVAELAARLSLPAEDIPLDGKNFELFRKQRLHGGLNRRQRRSLSRHGQRQADPDLARLFAEVSRFIKDIGRLAGRIGELRNTAGRGSSDEVRTRTADALKRISADVTSTFVRLSTSGAFVDSIQLRAGDLSNVSLSFSMRLKNGVSTTPKQSFSEANLDLLAFVILSSVTREAATRGQQKLMIIDDVFQSIDAGFRLRVLEHLMDTCPDWQFVITAHDRLWREQLRQILRRHSHSFIENEISAWTFDDGPNIISIKQVVGQLVAAIDGGSLQQICSEAGVSLERAANFLSYTLPISVTRRKDDRYTLADLWPGVCKILKRTIAANLAEEVDRWLHLRNLLGAHYNEWALTVSRDEAVTFADAVYRLICATWCQRCQRWVEEVQLGSGPQLGWRCRCGRVDLPKMARASAASA